MVIRVQVLKHLTGAREEKEGRKEQSRYQERSNSQKKNGKDLGVGVTEGKEVRGDDSIEYFLPTRVKSTF